MSNLLGGNSKQSQSSNTSIYNQAYSGLSQGLSPEVQNGVGASNLLSQLLTGTGGGQAYQNYQNSTGFENQLEQGSKAITNNAATAGLLNSGATLKALDTYGTNLANQNFNGYLSNLLGVGQLGNQAASTIGSTGGVTNTSSSGKGSSKQGLGI